MNKANEKIAVRLIAVLSLSLLAVNPAKAAGETVVIIDNVFDSTRADIKNNIVHEVCMTSGDFCSGRIMTAEGLGAANAPSNLVYKDDQTRHGTDLALVATKVNPNIRLILIRTSGISTRGTLNNVSDMSLYNKHFQWVINNASKYNIISVIFSKVPTNDNGSCTVKKVQDKQFVETIKSLTAKGVAVMAGSGNNGWTGKTTFPACIAETVSVGAMMDWQPGMLLSSNASSAVDFFAIGGWNLATKRVLGTSFSNAALGAYWAKNYQGSFEATYDFLKSKGKSESNPRVAEYISIDVTK